MPEINIRFNVTADGSVGAIGQARGVIQASMAAQGGATFAPSIRPFTIEATATRGAVGRAELVIERSIFTLEASGSEPNYGVADVTAPGFRSLFGVYRDTAPLFTLRALGEGVVAAVYQAYSINLKNGALTEYTNFPFNHLVRFQGETVAFTGADAYLLGADDDDGTAIDSVFELPPADFDTSKMKRMPYIYVGVKTDERLKVSAIADEQVTVASRTNTIGRTRRAKMARGIKGRHWAARVENTGGEHFAVDSVEYLPMILDRKV